MIGLPDAVETLPEALSFWAASTPDAIALLSPGHEPVTYGELGAAVERLAASLRAIGLGRGDGIALLIPEGPDLCLALLAAMSVGSAVPLPWDSPEHEYLRVLTHPVVRAIVTADASRVTTRWPSGHQVPIVTLSTGSWGRSGDVSVQGRARVQSGPAEAPDSQDVALILQSSGTTGRPKLVPRLHRGALAVARAIIAARAITAADRCLSLARLAYSQGFNSLAYTVVTGASLITVPRLELNAMSFWVEDYRPTIISTSPTVLLAIAADPGPLRDVLRRSPLRSIHCTAGRLAPDDLPRLEATFGVPILNGYGMSEAPAIAGEREPRMCHAPGTVLTPWCEVRIIGHHAEPAEPGEPGEIVVRGPTLFPGYLDDAEANAAAFLPDGWFRTGDQGSLDDAGNLHLLGRLNETVNRGGEMLSPQAVDDALLGHPAVAAAATFAVPDARLGEDIVAAVVLRPNETASPRELRGWMLDRLSFSKVPRRIWFVDDLPRTPTGKVLRVELSRRWREERR